MTGRVGGVCWPLKSPNANTVRGDKHCGTSISLLGRAAESSVAEPRSWQSLGLWQGRRPSGVSDQYIRSILGSFIERIDSSRDKPRGCPDGRSRRQDGLASRGGGLARVPFCVLSCWTCGRCPGGLSLHEQRIHLRMLLSPPIKWW